MENFDFKGDLKFDPEVFVGQENSLDYFSIESCNLNPPKIPESLKILKSLQTLILRKIPDMNLISAGDFGNETETEIRRLDFFGTNLAEIDEKSFEFCKNLKFLNFNFAKNLTEKFFDSISKNFDLRHLNLSVNKIRELKPRQFFSNPNLEFLDLSKNFLKILPEFSFFGLKKLKNLLLGINLIEKIEKNSFDGLENLQFLDLTGNFIRDLNENQWIGLKNLQNLRLGFCIFSNYFSALFYFSFI